MKVTLIVLGKTKGPYLPVGIEDYRQRIVRYLPFELVVVPDVRILRGVRQEEQMEREADGLLRQLHEGDYVVLLDEHGREWTSLEFAARINKRMSLSPHRLVFMIGGPYGFAKRVYERADEQLSLSRLTFSHQMVRLIFLEQLYRACTILHHEPYHHE